MYISVDVPWCTTITTNQEFTSSGYPSYYPDEAYECWRIVAPSDQVSHHGHMVGAR